jgi:hypothetical protein
MHHSKDKSDDPEGTFSEELELVYQLKIVIRNLMQKWGEEIFSNRQLGMSVCIITVKQMLLEQ